MSKSVIATAVGVLCIAGAAQAADASFDQLDVDRDGMISAFEAEADPKLLEQFRQLDVNGDGRLSAEEYAAYRKGE